MKTDARITVDSEMNVLTMLLANKPQCTCGFKTEGSVLITINGTKYNTKGGHREMKTNFYGCGRCIQDGIDSFKVDGAYVEHAKIELLPHGKLAARFNPLLRGE